MWFESPFCIGAGLTFGYFGLIQLPADIPGKAARDGPGNCVLTTTVSNPEEALVSWLQPGSPSGSCGLLSDEPADGKTLSPSLSLPFPFFSLFAFPTDT